MRIQIRMMLFLVACLISSRGLAQHYFEVRGADTKYRYFDWNFTFTNSVIADAFYVGVPGSNEFNLGGGYGFKPVPSLMIAPMAYAVVAKEAGQRGVKIAMLLAFEKKGWKVNSFLGYYEPIVGEVARYQVLDTLDASKVVHGPWEMGISNGFFHADRKWNPQIGPLLKLNDRLGSWYVSYRLGPQRELRFSRILLLKK